MDELLTPSDVIDALGGTDAAAAIFNVRPSAVSNWRKRGFSHRIKLQVSRVCAARGLPVADSAYEFVDAA